MSTGCRATRCGPWPAPRTFRTPNVIFRYTQDRGWLAQQLPSINLAADYLASLTDADGGVRGGGYYTERPTRIEYDGVAQCHAADAFRCAPALDRAGRQPRCGRAVRKLAERIAAHFRRAFWVKDHFAEYIHPKHGVIANHGLTNIDWAAIATGVADAEQTAVLWPKLKDEPRFYYGGMPTGLATLPDRYEGWEFATGPNDRYDLAAMGRVCTGILGAGPHRQRPGLAGVHPKGLPRRQEGQGTIGANGIPRKAVRCERSTASIRPI